jgi:hypothetical protein
MEILLLRVPSGFVAADDEATEQLRKYKLGSLSRLDVVQMRNGAFFRKWWALVKLGYDYFADSFEECEHKGQPVLPNFKRFRKDITILAGFHHAVWNVNGEMRLEADSLAWASMTEETFGKLYDATIQVLLNKVFNGKRVQAWTEQELRGVVEDIERFAA